jgi:hypothetical protein
MSHKIKISKKVIIIAFIVLIGVILIPIGYAYYVTSCRVELDEVLYRPSFDPYVEHSYDTNSLANTITNDYSYLAPGAEGQFRVDVDFDGVGANAYYKIQVAESAVMPENLHLYVNKERTQELDAIEGVYLSSIEGPRSADHIIYWKWNTVDTPEANENDNEFMNSYISIPIEVYVAESLQEKELVKVNDLENPTGVFRIDTLSGSFNVKLDFSRFNSSKSYAVYFDGSGIGDIHLYTDSGYQHEITSLSGTFNGSNSIINTPIYWRCEGTCDTYDNGGLYYIVYIS